MSPIFFAAFWLSVIELLRRSLSRRSNEYRAWVKIAFFVLVCIFGVSHLGVDSYQGSHLAIEPDEVEYAVTALRLAQGDSFSVSINGQSFPPRYPIWFPGGFLAPLFFLFGDEVGDAAKVVGITGALVLGVSFLIGFRLASLWGGVIAALTVFLIPGLRYFSQHVLIEAPLCLLVVVGALHFLMLRSSQQASLVDLLIAGLIAGLGVALRPTSVGLLLPFLLIIPKVRRKILAVALLCAPTIGFVSGSAAYNAIAFGSATRTGYHFWVPVPYEFPELVFGFRYLAENLRVLLDGAGVAPLVLVGLGVVLVQGWARGPRAGGEVVSKDLVNLALFTLLASLPILGFFLLYFYQTTRFFLPLQVLLSILVGAMLGRALSAQPFWSKMGQAKRLIYPAALLISLSAAGFLGLRVPVGEDSQNRAVADRLVRFTSPDAYVISGLNPAYFDLMVRAESSRTLIPVSRRVEYASKMYAPTRIYGLSPAPLDPFDARSPGLSDAGGKEVFEYTAIGSIDRIRELLSGGHVVFLDQATCEPAEMELVESRFELVQVHDQVARLES